MSNHKKNNKITKNNNVQMKTNHKFGDPTVTPHRRKSNMSAMSSSSWASSPPPKVPKPSHCGLELLGGGPRERTGVRTLQVHVVTVERLIQLALPFVISHPLASHETHIPVHLLFYSL